MSFFVRSLITTVFCAHAAECNNSNNNNNNNDDDDDDDDYDNEYINTA